ncbi:helix-turn-helix transcriptional regulator [Aestuariivirga litoralis]|uniref:Helix-turn-helix transcriptional regulator n=1 Tax=Aestuariivirga litoralis TaxID=2650924 RepID=A0A2W2ASF5_9HYPH|nr:LuxR C-terminal-related transcriptional regulator [Aestuariivirga litoralis]PZF78261.1 helix-turn-helix transcriptional regulator [Aestuariivirga litoralis]
MKPRLPTLIIIMLAGQIVCALIFMADVLRDLVDLGGPAWELLPEALASAALFAGIVFTIFYLRQLLRRKATLERSVGLASAALQNVIEQHFDDWKLTPSERDVASLMVKGLSISEIAGVRGSAEGTVKAHLNGIYRKANARNRAEVLSHIMDTLIDRPLLPAEAAQPGPARSAR